MEFWATSHVKAWPLPLALVAVRFPMPQAFGVTGSIISIGASGTRLGVVAVVRRTRHLQRNQRGSHPQCVALLRS